MSTYFVSPTGNNANPGTLLSPFKTIQHALNVAAHPGDTVEVRAGTYFEKLTFPHSGSAAGGYITLEAYPGEHPILNGTGVPSSDVGFGNDMAQIINTSYVKLIGFEIAFDKGNSTVDASGVHVEGFGTNIQILDNVIHDITGVHGMGISSLWIVADDAHQQRGDRRQPDLSLPASRQRDADLERQRH